MSDIPVIRFVISLYFITTSVFHCISMNNKKIVLSFKSTNQHKFNFNTVNVVPHLQKMHSKLQNEAKYTKHIIKVAKPTGTVLQVIQ